MSEEKIEVIEEVIEETLDGEVLEPSSVEEIAKEWGWNENYEGDNRVDAETFVRRDRDIRDASVRTSRTLKKEIASLRESVQNMTRSETGRLKNALSEQYQRIMAERNQAVEEGDASTFNEADQKIKNIEAQNWALDNANANGDARQKEFDAGQNDFQKDNKWYGDNRAMTAWAYNFAESLTKVDPDISADDYYKEIKDATKRQFPEEFTNPNRGRPSSVNSERATKGGGSNWGQLIKELPEAKVVFADFVEQGVYKDTKEDKERYAKVALEED